MGAGKQGCFAGTVKLYIMIHLTVHRIITGDEGTFGVLLAANKPFALTVERQWLDNTRGISCIPEGEYKVMRCIASPEYGFKNSPRFGDTFNIINVPNRSKILFHKGNLDQDSHGCIIIGEQFGLLHDDFAVLSSRQGFAEFMSLLKGQNEFELTIKNGW